MSNLDQLSQIQIAERLQDWPGSVQATSDIPLSDLQGKCLQRKCRPASVLIPFVRMADAWHLLFIRRSEFEHDRHSGQVAFAGGKQEPVDSGPESTALREAQEEVGIQPGHVKILGRLNPHYTISRFKIVPVVGVLPWPYSLNPDPAEVAHAFTIPLRWLADPNNYRLQYRQLEGIQQAVPVVYFEPYQGELLWGATARMTLSLMTSLGVKVAHPG